MFRCGKRIIRSKKFRIDVAWKKKMKKKNEKKNENLERNGVTKKRMF